MKLLYLMQIFNLLEGGHQINFTTKTTGTTGPDSTVPAGTSATGPSYWEVAQGPLVLFTTNH